MIQKLFFKNSTLAHKSPPSLFFLRIVNCYIDFRKVFNFIFNALLTKNLLIQVYSNSKVPIQGFCISKFELKWPRSHGFYRMSWKWMSVSIQRNKIKSFWQAGYDNTPNISRVKECCVCSSYEPEKDILAEAKTKWVAMKLISFKRFCQFNRLQNQ